MFRVFDKKNQKWITKNVYMSPNGDLYILKKSIFNGTKLELLEEGMYIYHNDINLYDKENKLVFEGDYLEAKVSKDKTVIGIVCYAHELSSYVILCVDSDEFFALGTEVCEFIRIIGNVFDGYEDNRDGIKAL